MLFDISELLNRKRTSLKVNINIQKENFESLGEIIEIKNPLFIDGIIRKEKEDVVFTGNLKGTVILPCSRCLGKFEYYVDLQLDERFSLKEDENTFEIKDEKISFNEVIESNIISSLPIRILCSEECKGLCPQCGANFNVSTCKCKSEEDQEETSIDPRFAELQNLFKDK
jgi:DUF177 domain-containing protein